jgi:peptide/nickel transport system substrate-binding protein
VLLSTGIAANAATVLGEFLSGAAIVGKPTANRNFAHDGDFGGSIDDELAAAIATPDTARQVALLREAQVKVLRDLPVFPLMTLGPVSARQGTLDLGYRPVAGYGWYDLAKARLIPVTRASGEPRGAGYASTRAACQPASVRAA